MRDNPSPVWQTSHVRENGKKHCDIDLTNDGDDAQHAATDPVITMHMVNK